jgi:BirA family biotin operon repressor/biotin-[acetyl-CoA-carboxylase] ligase
VIHAGGVVAEGEAVGVDEQGALLLAMPEGLQRIHSGEVSLRPA